MKKPRRSSRSTAPGPINLRIDVPGRQPNEPTRHYRVHLGKAKAGLVRVAANCLGLKLDTFILACLDGELTIEPVPIPAHKLARTRAQLNMVVAMLTAPQRAQLEAAARVNGYASGLDWLVAEQWSDIEQVRVSTPRQVRRLFPRTLWQRVTAMLGADQPQIIAPDFD